MREILEYGVKRLKFALEVCEIQLNGGLFFLLEHPAGATSWTTPPAQRMLKREVVETYEGDLCCHDSKQTMNGEELLIKKPTIFTTNSPLIGAALSLRCHGNHRHIELT